VSAPWWFSILRKAVCANNSSLIPPERGKIFREKLSAANRNDSAAEKIIQERGKVIPGT
jgi:hypothetical protein